MDVFNTQLRKLDTYIDALHDIKERINEEIPELRYDGIDEPTALKSFEGNMQKLHNLKTEIQHIYTSELNAVNYASLLILKIMGNRIIV